MFHVKHFLFKLKGLLFGVIIFSERNAGQSGKEHMGGAFMGKIISIANQKGGVGKTTTTVNLTAWIGAKGKKVLLVDIDPQGNATSGFGINKRSLAKSSYDLLIGTAEAEEVILSTPFQNVDVLPSNIALAGAEI